MDSDKIQKYLGKTMTILFILLVLMMGVNLLELDSHKKPPQEINRILAKQQEDMGKLSRGERLNENIPLVWPPKMNDSYPELPLIGLDRNEFNLERFRGKVVIVEFIDMSSPVSQAQSGANVLGPYGLTNKVDLDKGVRNFKDVLSKASTTGLVLPNDNVVQLKIIVHTQDGKQAYLDEAEAWARHFGFKEEDNIFMAVPKKDIRGAKTDTLISGYQLVDHKLRLRVDSAGPIPKHNLDMTFIPMLDKLASH